MARKQKGDYPAPRFTVGSLNQLLEMRLAMMDEGDMDSLAAAVGRIGDRYSVRNRMIMWAQMPDVTEVMGLTFWRKERGRRVRKGSKGLAYLAQRSKSKAEKERAAEAAGMDPEQAAKGKAMAGVCVRYVFDISQTSPIAPCNWCGAGENEDCMPDCTAEGPLRDVHELAEPYDVDELAELIQDIQEKAARRAGADGAGDLKDGQEDEEVEGAAALRPRGRKGRGGVLTIEA